jgi:hypothetical protein
VEGSQEGTTVGHTSAPSDADYLVVRQGDTYYAKRSNGHVPVVSETLKDVMDEIKASDTTIRFAAGEYDYGTVVTNDQVAFFSGLNNIQFLGAGIGVTTIRNNGILAADTEVFNFTRCNGVVIRDMTVHAGGPYRSTSDGIDFGVPCRGDYFRWQRHYRRPEHDFVAQPGGGVPDNWLSAGGYQAAGGRPYHDT